MGNGNLRVGPPDRVGQRALVRDALDSAFSPFFAGLAVFFFFYENDGGSGISLQGFSNFLVGYRKESTSKNGKSKC